MLIPVEKLITVYEDHSVVKLEYKGGYGSGGPIFYCPICGTQYSAFKLDLLYSSRKYDTCVCCGQWIEIPTSCEINEQVFHYTNKS